MAPQHGVVNHNRIEAFLNQPFGYPPAVTLTAAAFLIVGIQIADALLGAPQGAVRVVGAIGSLLTLIGARAFPDRSDVMFTSLIAFISLYAHLQLF